MSDWASGYVTGLGYTHGFYRELTPEILALAALASGVRGAGPVRSYCELGCGQGYSANLLAAANPDIAFHATDFNPAQVAGAQALADEAGTKNITFYDQSFGDFLVEPSLPEKFDVIALHGIYSWVGPDVRQQIIRFLDARLKPGGIVYISYNTLPGWASATPMRQLMYLQVKAAGGPTAENIRPAIDFLKRMGETNARYFVANPGVKERVEKLAEQSPSYLAHEYLNDIWTTFYHSDVARELAQARLSFLGSAHLLDHIDAINITADQRKMLLEAADPTFRQVLRDYMVNQQFRRDIFQRGSIPLKLAESREAWLERRFALSSRAEDVPLKVKGTLGEADLQKDTYLPLIESLAAGPKTVRALLGDEKIAALGWPKLQQALVVLAGGGNLQPCPDARGDAARRESARGFNRAVMNRARYSADLGALASPVTGGAIAAGRFEQLFLLGMKDKNADPVQFAWQVLDAQNERINKDGKPLETREENIAELKTRFDTFSEKRVPVMKQLGIA